MLKGIAGVSLAAAILAVTPGSAQEQPPAWAYPEYKGEVKPPADDGSIRRVPDSSAGYTLSQVRDRFLAPDWHPGDHPAMPDSVSKGRKPDVLACGFCHRADGPGGPENANLMGLPHAYIVRQMADLKSGRRKSAVQERLPTQLLEKVAKSATDEEVQTAAAYFSSIRPRAVIKVVESDSAPKTYVNAAWFLAPLASGEKEPLGQRIIEVAEDVDRFISRDARVTFIAYVPPGSIKQGETLATTGGNGKTIQCDACHGPDLKGLGEVPGIAGRSPTAAFRQLFDFKHGARDGEQADLMKPSVQNLDINDMIALSAYAASLAP
jgi:cytochrome c553